MLGKSHYLTLGIPRSENAAGIRRAFRDQVKRYHPERVGSARAGFFEEIVQAYHMLSNPERRRDYDRALTEAKDNAAAGPSVSPASEKSSGLPQLSPALRAPCFKDAVFEAALAGVSQNLTAAQHHERGSPEPLTVRAILSATEAVQGGMLELAVPSCSPCRRCGGAGRQGLFPCELCDGEGLREEEEVLRVPVPANVGDGTLIKVPLRGLGPHNFYLCVQIRVGWSKRD
jgi:molecular chaperone DnaJ